MFPELVAAVAAATEAEVLTAFVAGLHTAGHVLQQALELGCLRGLHQGKLTEVAQVEGAVAVAGDREQFRVKGGEVALPVDAEDRERTVELVLRHALVALNQGDHLIELPQNHRVAVLFTQAPEGPQEIAVLGFHGHTLHGGGGVDPFLFLHVEADIIDAVVAEEAVHPLRLFHRIGGHHGNAVEGHLMAMQRLNAFHRHGVGAATVAEAPMGIVDVLRPIHADAHHDAVAAEAVAPGVVDQGGVGLNVLGELQLLGTVLLQAALKDRCGLVVPARRQSERLAGMPHQRELRAGIRTFQNATHQKRQQIQVKDPFLLPIGQVAVGAVEVAERCGLNHHEADGPEPAEVGPCFRCTDHQLTKPPPPFFQPPPPLRQPPW